MNEEIQRKLNDLQQKLQVLKSKKYQDGQNECESIIQFIKRIIERLYPERQAMDLKNQLYRYWGSGNDQTDYVNQIDLAIRVINTMKAENELFGLDDFKPLK